MAQSETPPESYFFDAHTHLQFGAFDEDRDAILARAREAKVKMINVGTESHTSRLAVELAEKAGDGVYAAIGLHPTHTAQSFHDEQELGKIDLAKAHAADGEIFDTTYYRQLAASPKVVAIGECGLDYFRLNSVESHDVQIMKQRDSFLAQIAFAEEIKKPLMIHCRNAFADLIGILKSAHPHGNGASPGALHFFTGTPDDARALADLGFSFTFGGVITFARNYDLVIERLPIDRILSETDAPYVAPEPYRGTRNEPTYVIEVVKKLAELKKVSLEEMRHQLWENARRVFAI
jgi:TatD DNase family protein